MEEARALKQALRERVWRALEEAGEALFPGAWGRIPNFRGAAAAAHRLRQLPIWRQARVLKCNPDLPQLPLRRAALQEGKTVYMAVPRLRQLECFLELDPQQLGSRAWRAATIAGAFRYGRAVHPRQLPPIDLVVCGSVAVDRQGGRIGKGGGYSDLEFAIAAHLGKVGPQTAIVTTVHPLQVLDRGLPMLPHDIPLDYIVTPLEVIVCPRRHPRPEGIYWDLLEPEKLAAVPVLAWLRQQGA
ncbi:MAG TPA: 5-formyltetrahydrofolate cyclo-ligase [Dehalococcoidia bacterium]|nr:5-formyltetrahydrofolate cyclo-ligase [Dehalococcoidia bacterium]